MLTHRVPEGWPRPASTVHFVTDGLESAVRQANDAGEKAVGVHGADTTQQLLKAGLLDESSVDVAALLLGSGVRLFDRSRRDAERTGESDADGGSRGDELRYQVGRA